MVPELVLWAAVALATLHALVEIAVVWLLVTFHRQAVKRLWDEAFEDLMWLSFAEAAEQQQNSDDGELGMAGGLGQMLGDGDEQGQMAQLAQLAQLAQQLDGADLGSISGADGADAASQIEGWS